MKLYHNKRYVDVIYIDKLNHTYYFDSHVMQLYIRCLKTYRDDGRSMWAGGGTLCLFIPVHHLVTITIFGGNNFRINLTIVYVISHTCSAKQVSSFLKLKQIFNVSSRVCQTNVLLTVPAGNKV